jgi:hypothetical protein
MFWKWRSRPDNVRVVGRETVFECGLAKRAHPHSPKTTYPMLLTPHDNRLSFSENA